MDDYKYGECRSGVLRHGWDRRGPVRPGKARGSIRVSLGCERCTMGKQVVYDKNGKPGRPRYFPPKGYRLPKDTNINELRLSVLRGWRRS